LSEVLEVPDVPSINRIGVALERAAREQRIINYASDYSGRGGAFDGAVIFAVVEGDHYKPLANVVKEEQGLFAAKTMSSRQSGQSRVNRGQTMRRAATLAAPGFNKDFQARRMMFIVFHEDGDKDRCVEERVQRLRARFAWSRSCLTRSVVA